MVQNLYDLLNVSPYADKDEIRASFKKLAKKFHPDLNKTKEAEWMFKKINNAAEILLNDFERFKYNVSIGIREKIIEPDINFENKFIQEKRQDLGSIFNGFFKKKNETKKIPKDITVNVTIDTKEALFGCFRKINIMQSEKCPKCRGRKFINSVKCPLCSGKGEINEHKKITVKIPPGIKNNGKLKLKGEGEKGKGGACGDLYVIVSIKEPECNKEIEKQISITPTEAIFGTKIEIQDQNELFWLSVPAMSQTGQKFKIEGKTRNLNVEIVIKIPKNLSENELNLYGKIMEIELRKNREDFFS